MIIVAGTIRIPTDNIEKARPFIDAVVKASRAEPGNELYSFALDMQVPGMIRVFEIYRDQAALDSHRQSDHFKAWRASNPDLGIGDRDITIYTIESHQKA